MVKIVSLTNVDFEINKSCYWVEIWCGNDNTPSRSVQFMQDDSEFYPFLEALHKYKRVNYNECKNKEDYEKYFGDGGIAELPYLDWGKGNIIQFDVYWHDEEGTKFKCELEFS